MTGSSSQLWLRLLEWCLCCFAMQGVRARGVVSIFVVFANKEREDFALEGAVYRPESLVARKEEYARARARTRPAFQSPARGFFFNLNRQGNVYTNPSFVDWLAR